MQYKHYILILSMLGVLFTSCIKDDISHCPVEITIAFAPQNYIDAVVSSRSGEITTRAAATAQEMQVDNAYILLFDNAGANPLRYYITPTTNERDYRWDTYTGSALKFYPFNTATNTYMSAADLGTRKIYVFANVSPDLKTTLDDITTETVLLNNQVVHTGAPWAITTPLLMEGFATHDFAPVGNYITNPIPLRRAVAKLEVNITLDEPFQSVADTDYKYRYLDFGNRTFLMENANPQVAENVVHNVTNPATDWVVVPTTSLTKNSAGLVTGFTLTTYINEYKNTATNDLRPKVEIQLPYKDGGLLPPPEFGPATEQHILQLPIEVKRNHYYTYDVEVK